MVNNNFSPGLVVMGRDLRSEGRGFESWHRILDGHFVFVLKNFNYVCLKRPKINKKEAGVGQFFKKNNGTFSRIAIYT